MSIIFPEKEEMNSVDVKFVEASLPEAGKPYYLRTANQVELDLRDVGVKAKAYKLTQDPDAMINGFITTMETICYLVASGFRVKTDYLSAGLRLPGEYLGSETSLPEDIFPLIGIQASAKVKQYIKERVKIKFDGTFEKEGLISRAVDDATKAVNEAVTIGSVLTIHGRGLKVIAEEGKEDLAGVYFMPSTGGVPTKSRVITLNHYKTLKVLVPSTLVEGKQYYVLVDTWSRPSRGGGILKKLRTVQSEFTLIARKPAV